MKPGDIAHIELYESPLSERLYSLMAKVKRSGGYLAETRKEWGNRGSWYKGAKLEGGYKTIKGAINAARRMVAEMEDVMYLPEVDG